MPRISGVLAGVLLPVVTLSALSGCSSSSKDGDGATKASASSSTTGVGTADNGSTGSGSSNGRLDYTGSLTGGFDMAKGVDCVFKGGKLFAVMAPSDRNSATPESFGVTGEMTVLVTKDVKVFATTAAGGMSAAQKDGSWTVTVSGKQLTDAVDGATITVHGHLTCTKKLDM